VRERTIDASALERNVAGAVSEWRALGDSDDTFAVEGMRPSFACAPSGEDELSALLRAANDAGVAVIPWGGGTRMSLGFPPRAADVVAETRRLDEIVEYEPADLTVTVQAGITLAALQSRLRAEGQMLALDPAAADRATIGGLTSANASGPLRLMYGSARDLVIGTRVVNADGVISKSGGRVVKNVAGYDLNKLYVGALGTVGVVVQLSFKLHPLPQAQSMLVAAFRTVDDASKVVAALMRSPLGPAAVELLDATAAREVRPDVALPDGGCLLVVAAHGFEAAIVRSLRDLRELCSAATDLEDVRDEAALDTLSAALREFPDPSRAGSALLKAAVPPSRSASTLATIRREARDAGFEPALLSHAGSGIVYARLSPQTWEDDAVLRLGVLVERVRAHARGEGGSLVVEACPTAAKRLPAFDVWGDPGSAFPVMQALKQNLDPKGTLNPGRFIGRL